MTTYITFHPTTDEYNAVVSPEDAYEGPYWTLIGSGPDKDQNRLAEDICNRLNRALTAEAQVESLKARIKELETGVDQIRAATLAGEVCDDVAWFDEITTLHDFCELLLDPPRKGASDA